MKPKTSGMRNDVRGALITFINYNKSYMSEYTFEAEELERKRMVLKKNLKRDGLTSGSTSGYAIGHVYNDLCAAAWFNYLLFYVTKVINVPNSIAGFVILAG